MNTASPRLSAPPAVPPHPQSPDGRWIGDMPLCDFAEFRADRTAPGEARRHLAKILAEWDLGRLRESAEIVLSELTTNSVAATSAITWPGDMPPVRLWLRANAGQVRLIVGDAVPQAPLPQVAGPDDESGRGLAIVAALSGEWGHYQPVIPFGGKVTWALISTP